MSRTLSESFDRKNNSLNTIRLALAALVVVSHAWPLGGFGPDPAIGATTLGSIAVFGFFGISGYLITASRLRLSTGRYFWHRFLRIYPGFWICFIVIAAAFGPAAWMIEKGTISGYPVFESVAFVFKNMTLRVVQPDIAGTLETSPYGHPDWNGATWTLIFEFICYAIVGLLFLCRALTPRVTALIFGAVAALLIVESFRPGTIPAPSETLFKVIHPEDVIKFLTTFASFAAGSLLYMYRGVVKMSWVGAASAAILAVVAMIFMPVAAGVIAFPIVYLSFWLAIKLPFENWFRRDDYSYGLYIYAYPVAQLLGVMGATALGVGPYLILTMTIALAFAALSNTFVEKPALRLKDISLPRKTGKADLTQTGSRS